MEDTKKESFGKKLGKLFTGGTHEEKLDKLKKETELEEQRAKLRKIQSKYKPSVKRQPRSTGEEFGMSGAFFGGMGEMPKKGKKRERGFDLMDDLDL